jgi:Rrf2 family iron-sulfur cluster assembly transcriptional regulator
MILTTKSRYAVMAMLHISLHSKNQNPINLGEISAKQNIAINYLEQIFYKLKGAKLVKSVKGPGGGYLLDKDLSQLTIKDITDAVEENLEMTRCNKQSESCIQGNSIKCDTHYLWEGLSLNIQNYLATITLQDLSSGKLKERVITLRSVQAIAIETI